MSNNIKQLQTYQTTSNYFILLQTISNHNKLPLLPALFLILFSCSTQKTEEKGVKTIDLSKIIENPVSENIFNEVRYIQLETGPEFLLGDQLNTTVENGTFYIQDLAHQKAILVFDENGKFIQRIGQEGKGPKEYQHAMDFDIRRDTIDIFGGSGSKRQIYSYLKSGEFCKKNEVSYAAFSFEAVNKTEYLLCTSFNKPLYSHRVYKINTNGEETAKLLLNDTKIELPFEENNFSVFGDKVYYREALNNKIYQFFPDTLMPVFELDFGAYHIPPEFYQMDISQGFEMITKKGVATIKSFYTNNQYSIFEIARQKSSEPTILLQVTYNHNTGEIKSQILNEDNYIFRYPIGLNDKNEMMFVVFPMGDLQKEFENYGLQLSVPDFNETKNPIIVSCKI